MKNKKIVPNIFKVIALTLFLLYPLKSGAYYGLGGIYGGSYGGIGVPYGGFGYGMYGNLYGGFGGGLYSGLYSGLGGGLFGGLYSGLYSGLGSGLYSGLYSGLGSGLYGGLYGGLGSGLYGGLGGGLGLGLSTPLNINGLGTLGGLYGLNSSLYSPSSLLGTPMLGLGGLSSSLYGLGTNSLGGLFGQSGLTSNIFRGGLSVLPSSLITRTASAITTETWVGQWLAVQNFPIPAFPLPISPTTGAMTLTLVEDTILATATGNAVLDLNTYLGGGVSLTGKSNLNIVTLTGIVQSPFIQGGLINVNITCIQDTATHMTGEYELYDFINGYYRYYQTGSFELTLQPTVII